MTITSDPLANSFHAGDSPPAAAPLSEWSEPLLVDSATPDLPDASAGRPSRDRYIDTLRVAALFRVILNHTFGWIWLPFVFPSMGIMFALAGSLTASSLDRAKGDYLSVIRKRTRRLLPPVWLLGAIIIPLMLVHNWHYNNLDGSVPFSWKTLLFWVFPISDPPGSSWGISYVDALWYIRAYLWFTLLSPALLWAFRRWPKRVLALPIGLSLLTLNGNLDGLSARSFSNLSDLGTYGACWLLGFAHFDGRIRKLSLKLVLPLTAAFIGGGFAYALTHPDPYAGVRVDAIPFAQMLYCTGGVLLLLRFYPSFKWLARHAILDRIVTVINARAMTIYLWGNVAIALAIVFINSHAFTRQLDATRFGAPVLLLYVFALIFVAMLLFGWVEDLAANRRVRFAPWSINRADAATAGAGSRLGRRVFPGIMVPDALAPKVTQVRERGLVFVSSGFLLIVVIFSWALWPRAEPAGANRGAHLASSGVLQPGSDATSDDVTDADDDSSDNSGSTPDEPDAPSGLVAPSPAATSGAPTSGVDAATVTVTDGSDTDSGTGTDGDGTDGNDPADDPTAAPTNPAPSATPTNPTPTTASPTNPAPTSPAPTITSAPPPTPTPAPTETVTNPAPPAESAPTTSPASP